MTNPVRQLGRREIPDQLGNQLAISCLQAQYSAGRRKIRENCLSADERRFQEKGRIQGRGCGQRGGRIVAHGEELEHGGEDVDAFEDDLDGMLAELVTTLGQISSAKNVVVHALAMWISQSPYF
jgi:hypothetical protein